MRTHAVVVDPEALQHHPGLLERVEDLALQELVAELGDKGFRISVLPGGAGLDVDGLDAVAR